MKAFSKDTKFMYVARNEDGTLHLWIFTGVPQREDGAKRSNGLGIWKFSIDTGYRIPDDLFPDLRWEDEPIKVTLKEATP